MSVYIPMIINSEYKMDLTCTDDRKVTGFAIKTEYASDFTPTQIGLIQNDIIANYKGTYISEPKIDYVIPTE